MANGNSAVVPKRRGATLDAGMSDGELLGRFNAHRDESAEAAFGALVRRHGPMVLRVCGHVLGDKHGAEDAFQATFLVLARKSASIRRPESLGNWLYGVALRTAWEAKMRDGRRRQLESPTPGDGHREPALDSGPPDEALICREELEALHEEVSRLPERYRVPVVLCELEGLTYQEVADRMHCPVSTIGVRLARARERLRVRMIRRGIVPAAALTHVIFGAEGASTLIPSVLVDSTVRAAAGFAASDAAATGFVSAAVVALTHAVLRTMALTRLKVATGVVLVAGLAATVGLVGGRGLAKLPLAAESGRSGGGGGATPRANPSTAAVAPANLAASPSPPPPAAPVAPGADRPGVEIVAAMLRDEEKPDALRTLASLRRKGRAELTRGEVLFFKEWARNDPASPNGDGLGPVYNETSCVACHGLGAPGGAGPEGKNVVLITALSSGAVRVPTHLDRIHPGFGNVRSTVLHRYGTDPTYGSWRRHFFESQREKSQALQEVGEETVEARIKRFAGQAATTGRSRDRSSRVLTASGITLGVSERNTPALFGAGRIDAIPSEVLVLEAASQPGHVRGRVSRDREGRVGRFGWKGQVASLHEFVRVACAGELGLEVPGHSQSISPLAPLEKAKGLDLAEPDCDALVAFVRALPAPVAVDPDGPRGSREMADGRRLFAGVGCATCHAPSLGEVRGIYSDLLLHDMGPSLGDSGEYYGPVALPDSPGGPSPNEWRTPPLWGFRDSGPYLHDGRAETVEEAVALHGGQGTQSARQFFALSPEERSRVEAFLKSLVAPSSASAPGVVLAAELESRIVPEEARQAEALVRKRRIENEAREVERQAEARLRQAAEAAAKLAPSRFRMAVMLERAGRIDGAIEFYRQIARDSPKTKEGRSSAERIAALLSLQ